MIQGPHPGCLVPCDCHHDALYCQCGCRGVASAAALGTAQQAGRAAGVARRMRGVLRRRPISEWCGWALDQEHGHSRSLLHGEKRCPYIARSKASHGGRTALPPAFLGQALVPSCLTCGTLNGTRHVHRVQGRNCDAVCSLYRAPAGCGGVVSAWPCGCVCCATSCWMCAASSR